MFPRPNLTCPCCGRPMAVTFGQKFLLCSTAIPQFHVDHQPDFYGAFFSCPGCAKALEAPGWVHWLPALGLLAVPAALLHWERALRHSAVFPKQQWFFLFTLLLTLYPVFVLLAAWFCPLHHSGSTAPVQHRFLDSELPLPRISLPQKRGSVCPACGADPAFSASLRLRCVLRPILLDIPLSRYARGDLLFSSLPHLCRQCATLLCCPWALRCWRLWGLLLIWCFTTCLGICFSGTLLLFLLWYGLASGALFLWAPLSVHPYSKGRYLSLP